jgi:hypothetical protein
VNTVMKHRVLYRWLNFLPVERLSIVPTDFSLIDSSIIDKAVENQIFPVSPELIIYKQGLAPTHLLKIACNHIFMDLRLYLFIQTYYKLYILF